MKVNFAETCLRWADSTPDNVAVHSVERGDFTYRWLSENARCFAKVLRRYGIAKGDRCLVILPSIPEAAIVFLGTQLVGAVPVMAFPGYGEKELGHVFHSSRPVLVITTTGFLEKISGFVAGLSSESLIIIDEKTESPSSYAALMQECSADSDLGSAQTDEDDLAELIFTSGTTGMPKGIPHTHGNLIRTCASTVVGWGGIGPGDVVYTSGPLSFAIGLHCHFHLPFFEGASSLYTTERVSPERFLELAESNKVTHIMTSATQLWNVLSIPPRRERLRTLKCLGVGGAAVSGELAEKWLAAYGTEIQASLAMTETLGAVFRSLPGELSADTLGSVVPGWEFKLIDPDEPDRLREVSPGETGVLWLKGPTLLPYYWNDPELTNERIKEGWFNSCDLARVDEEGHLRHMGRSDEVIKSAGWRISPIEIEDVLKGHLFVEDVAVVGIPDPHRGQAVVAVIVLSETAGGGMAEKEALAEELSSFVRAELAGYKVPKFFLFREKLPRTANGKIQRKHLSRELEESGIC